MQLTIYHLAILNHKKILRTDSDYSLSPKSICDSALRKIIVHYISHNGKNKCANLVGKISEILSLTGIFLIRAYQKN